MVRSSALTALALVVGVLTLGACGKDDGEGPAAGPPAASTPAEPPPAAENPGAGPPPGKGPNRPEQESEREVDEQDEQDGERENADASEHPNAAVEESLGRTIRPGQPVVISSECDGGHCTVRYRSGPRGGGVVLSEQAPILRRLLADDDVRSVQLYVHHQSVGNPEKNERPAFATTTCRRADHPEFAWAEISHDDIPRRCRSTRVPGGRQRSLIKRGLLTDEEASRGAGSPRRGGNNP